ncbi:MAG: UDP-N-acetylmuramoyl-L-alanyl-D-glutamate--2,6-diaminopimelate ligase, partial [Desulfopila sp.]|nr:UDP-N-acetylmuramoyl-L-alanyl-D-glutamate--2,6-diaminopimelate ligase [Desulfopila sp.]
MTPIRSLDYLLEQVSCKTICGPEPSGVLIESLITDSRKASRGALFVALPGEKQDGHVFLDKAVKAGCVALVVEEGKFAPETFSEEGVTVIVVDNTREALGPIAASFFAYPEKELRFVGITGTNGKTTITYLLEKILDDLGFRVGVIGTVNYRFRDQTGVRHEYSAPFTTPEPVLLQKMLREMADAGVDTVFMEVSSHALAQNRLGRLKFDYAVFTNLSHDHLDYHSTLEEYFQAKTRLFLNHMQPSGKAVITFQESDDPQRNRWPSELVLLLRKHGVDFVTTGAHPESVAAPLLVNLEIDKTILKIRMGENEVSVVSPLVGRFNADNLMTTLGVAHLMGCKRESVVSSLATAGGAPGRLEKVVLKESETPRALAFVDYAHTPDALLNVLSTLKGLPHNRLVCVFGCGGDRDKGKRPEMGKIAARYADIVIVTDDNPRSEKSEVILDHIMKGVRSTGMVERAAEWLYEKHRGNGCVVIADRQRAIAMAIQCAGADDVVLIAGKGHEKYQLTNAGKRHFDDCLEVMEAQLSWDVTAIRAALGPDSTSFEGNCTFSGITTDSRNIVKRQVFVALQGESFDGHDYIEPALSQGAAALIVAKSSQVEHRDDLPVFRVDDTLKALGDLAAYRRRRLGRISAPLVAAITGCTGKTTVKEMTAAIFFQQWPDTLTEPNGRVLKTQGNFNNLVGLPLSLLPLQL